MDWVCDFLPYQFSNTYFRTLDAVRPEDWSGTSLTSKSDDFGRFVECAGAASSGWFPSVVTSTVGEVLGQFMLRPGTYGDCAVHSHSGYHVARVDVTAGMLRVYRNTTLLHSVALPASMWTSSSVYSDCWLRMKWDHGGGADIIRAKVWSVNEAEPAGFPAFSVGAGPATPSGDPVGIGASMVTTTSACRWFGYSDTSPGVSPRSIADADYFNKWIKLAASEGVPRILTAEIFVPGWDGASNTTYTTAVLRAAIEGYDGGNAWPYRSETPSSSLRFADCVSEWPTIDTKLPETIFGRQEFTISDLIIDNTNGVRDDWLRAKMTNGFVMLRMGDPSWPWYDHRPIFTGAVKDVTESPGKIQIQMRDAGGRFDRQVHRTTLVTTNGNNGKPTPIAAGSVFNATPVLIDDALLKYKIGEANINSISAVRDKGVSLTTITNTIISFDATDNSGTTMVAHNLLVNDAVVLAGRLPSPLSAGTYYVQSIPAADKLRFSSTVGGAVIDLTQGDAGNVSVNIWASTDTIRTTAAHGRSAGNILRAVPSLGQALTGGLTENTDLYVIATGLTTNELKVSLTGGGAAIDLTGNTQTVYAAHSLADEIEFAADHGLVVNGLVRFSGTPPANVSTGVDYFVKTVPTSKKITMSLTLGGATHDVQGTGSATTVSAVNTGTDTITLASGSAYAVGDQFDMDGTPPAPLVAGTAYWVQAKPATNDIKVCATPGGAVIDITGSSTGSNVRRYVTGATCEKPVPSFTLVSYAGTGTVDQFIPDLAAGTFTLRQNPAGQITCDFQGQKLSGAYSGRASHALKVLTGFGDPMISTSLGDGTLYDNWRLIVGVYLTETANLADMIDWLAMSCGSVWRLNRVGTLISKLVTEDTPVITITDSRVKPDGQLLMTAKLLPVDRYEGVRVGFKKNYTEQRDSDLAGSVSLAYRALYKEPYSLVVLNQGGSGNLAGLDLGEKGQRRKLPLFETALINQTDAEAQMTNPWIWAPKQVGVFSLTVTMFSLDEFVIGKSVLVKTSRYGINPAVGKAFLVTGVKENIGPATVELTLMTQLDGFYPVTT